MKKKLIASTLFTCMLAACGSSKNANNGNFEKALNAHFQRDCITIQPFVMAAEGNGYPMTVVMQQKNDFIKQAQVDQNNATITRAVDALVKAGVLSVSDGTKQEKSLFGNREITVPTKVYALTDAGKKAIVNPAGTAMCIGHYKVDEIVRFTEPSNAMGQTISTVSFTVSPVDVPDWAKSEDVQKLYGLNTKLAEHAKATRTVVLASDGWVDDSDFSR